MKSDLTKDSVFEVVTRPWAMDEKPVVTYSDRSRAIEEAKRRNKVSKRSKAKDKKEFSVRERLTEIAVAKAQAEVYAFSFSGGRWANFTLCETTGEFSIHSDWGDYSYSWPSVSARANRTLKEFIATTSDTYVADKLAGAKSEKTTFDAEATKIHILKRIAKAAKEPDCKFDSDEVKELRQAVEDLDTDLDQSDFFREMSDIDVWVDGCTVTLQELLQADHLYEDLQFRYDGRYLFLRDTLMPFFRHHLRTELAAAPAVNGKDEEQV